MEELLHTALDTAAGEALAMDSGSTPSAMVFVLVTALGLLMALIYVPLRLYFTLTERSRRLRLLQRIRRLREELGQPISS
ncbi:conserved hypothetical protein [Cyanobium sp. PCC 7001]|uniref:hypothetical protein n=1 Tax=Cyanobium sp. PCC 7001 TaxID=180281 RepID=UPI00018057F9|nr:hypothetical protein [Cyanobium sp. PCC 7001]EDY37653.1 conserved hypothetical protein [Cyanobium sp. PCC 7001]